MNENFLKQLQMLYPLLSELKISGSTVSYKEIIVDVSSFSVQQLFMESKLLSRDIISMSSEEFLKVLSLNKRGLEKKKKDLEVEVLDITGPIELLTIDDEMFSLRMKESAFLKLLETEETCSKAEIMQMNLYYIFLQELKEQENYLFKEVKTFLENYEKKMLEIETIKNPNENQKQALIKWKKLFPKDVVYIGEVPKKNFSFSLSLLSVNGYVSSLFVVGITIVFGILVAILFQ